MFTKLENLQWVSLQLGVVIVFSLLVILIINNIWLRNNKHDYGGLSKNYNNFPPGSRCLFPYIGETLQFMASIYSNQGFYSFVHTRHQWYGNCFKTHIFGETHIFVSSTESAKEILSNDLGKFTKRYIRSIGEVVGKESLLCASYKNHKHIRGKLLDLFSSNSISEFTKQFDHLVIKTIATWKSTTKVVILDQALEITSKAMCKMLLSIEDGRELKLLQKDITCVCQAMLAFPFNFPHTRFYKGLQARKRIMGILDKKIKESRENLLQATSFHPKDFLQHLVLVRSYKQCSSVEQSMLTDAQIKDNILTMIIAGQDTTASAITWMVKYLDENPSVLLLLKDEINSIETKFGNNSSLTLEKLNEMPYAAKVVKECLRMASVVPWFPRVALHDCNIQGYMIKKGWNINVDARSIHLDPTLYVDPHKFNPSRFDDEPKPYSFLGFGAGGRTCLGLNLAKTMMVVFLYRLVTTYKWKVIDTDSSVEKWSLFSKLKTGYPVQVTPI